MREKEGGVQPFRRPEEKGHLMSFTRMHTHTGARVELVPTVIILTNVQVYRKG